MNFGMNFPGLSAGHPGASLGAFGLGNQNPMATSNLMMQFVMTQLMMMTQLLMQLTGAGGGGGIPMGASFGGGSPAGGPGVGNFLGGGGGGATGTGGAAGATGAAAAPGTGEKGTGQAAVDLARKYLGRDSIGLKGDMPHFTAAGGVTNNCVDFVSSALESQGLVKGHHINVRAFEKELQKQGWVQVPAAQAKPGDVWINHSRGHTELVATQGATKLIGSNGSARQKVSEHANNPSSGVIYQKR